MVLVTICMIDDHIVRDRPCFLNALPAHYPINNANFLPNNKTMCTSKVKSINYFKINPSEFINING